MDDGARGMRGSAGATLRVAAGVRQRGVPWGLGTSRSFLQVTGGSFDF